MYFLIYYRCNYTGRYSVYNVRVFVKSDTFDDSTWWNLKATALAFFPPKCKHHTKFHEQIFRLDIIDKSAMYAISNSSTATKWASIHWVRHNDSATINLSERNWRPTAVMLTRVYVSCIYAYDIEVQYQWWITINKSDSQQNI